ncbi:hypothetical protein [Altibacter sp. HG106]|uniref:hypothetical protein n=1 Tax=Altibacter sp. HG106 TaxID=3023937 RepID=UPI00235003C9|nr:hypothetical protein [Altibacter sp. HG106]MDC7996339.1 hypothetical protein [Altibacter sp. HG106]
MKKIILLITSLLIAIGFSAQENYNLADSEFNGIYSANVEKGRKTKLTNIYLYEYGKKANNSKLLCLVEQFEGKKSKGIPKRQYSVIEIYKKANDYYRIRKIKNLGGSDTNFLFDEFKIISTGKSYNVSHHDKFRSYGNYLDGIYTKTNSNDIRYSNFLNDFYKSLFDEFNYSYDKKEIVLGSLEPNTNKDYKSGISLWLNFSNFQQLHNDSILNAEYKIINNDLSKTKVEILTKLIPHLMRYQPRKPLDPFIMHFPKNKTIYFKDSNSQQITHKLKIIRTDLNKKYDSFQVYETDNGIKENEKQLTNIAANELSAFLEKFKKYNLNRDYFETNVFPFNNKSYDIQLLHYTENAKYFYIPHNWDAEKAEIFVVKSIRDEEDFADLKTNFDFFYEPTVNFIQNLENDIIPKITNRNPRTNSIQFKYVVENQTKNYPFLGNKVLLAFTLESRGDERLAKYDNLFKNFWTQSKKSIHLIPIDRNSKSLYEAITKFDKTAKGRYLPSQFDQYRTGSRFYSKLEEIRDKHSSDKEKKLKVFYSNTKYKYLSSEFWNKNDPDSQYLRNIYNGDFLQHYPTTAINHLLMVYVNYVSEYCRGYLSNNADKVSILYPGDTGYSYTLYLGNMSFADVYDKKTDSKIVDIYMEPELLDHYRESFEKRKFTLLGNMPASWSGNKKIFEVIGCDKIILDLFKENIIRYIEARPSVQMEAGLFNY